MPLPELSRQGYVYLQVKGRIHKVHIFLIQLLAQQLHGLTKALEMHHLTLPEELDHIVHIRVIRKPQDIVVSYSCLLLRWGCVKSFFFPTCAHSIMLSGRKGSGTMSEILSIQNYFISASQEERIQNCSWAWIRLVNQSLSRREEKQ